MMRKAKSLVLLLCLSMFIGMLNTPIMAYASYVPYTTYTYDTEKDSRMYFNSPHAYVPAYEITANTMGLAVPLNNPSDMVIDNRGYIYIADTGNNRVVVLSDEYKQALSISGYILEDGTAATFNQPKAVFVTADGELYIGDTLNGRIVVFDSRGFQKKVIDAPSAEQLENVIYEPSALVVDKYDQLYVISQSSEKGILTFDANGEFQGFIGAEKTQGDIWDIILDNFKSDEQKAREIQNVPSQYNNIVIDEAGFLYVTNSSFTADEQVSSMTSKDGSKNPIKRLNPSGTDVLKRNGAFNQGGDLQINGDCSRFIDIALTSSNVYSALDATDGKIFTYDENGNLMYVFGGKGMQLGVFQMPVAMTYRGTDLLVLDARTGSITVFTRTEYGDEFAKALELQSNRKYTEATEQWKKVLSYNSNYEPAYKGIASSYMRLGMYKEAMDNYQYGNDLDGYKDAYALYRKEVLSDYVLLIPVVVVLLVFLIRRVTKRITAINKAGWSKKGKPTLKEELCYAWYVIFHPFDGFYELKRSKKGGVRGATIFLVLAVLESLFRQVGTGYISTGKLWARVSVADAFMSVGFLVLLWTVGNWALTTLMDGKGRMKDIYVASCYSLLPMIMFGFPATLFTNVCTGSELQFVNFFYSLGTIWTLALIFFGALITNDYSLLKNVVTTVCSVISMAFIAFVGVLAVDLFVSMYDFIRNIADEIIYRI